MEVAVEIEIRQLGVEPGEQEPASARSVSARRVDALGERRATLELLVRAGRVRLRLEHVVDEGRA